MRRAGVALLALLAACGPADAPGRDESAAELDALAEAHRDDRGDQPGVVGALPEELPFVFSREIEYAQVDGQAVTGYLARPEGSEARPGVLVIHEWWGLNSNIREITRRLAAEGYVALAVDLFQGGRTADPDVARHLVAIAMQRSEAQQENLRQAAAFLRDAQRAPRIGVIGWCFGGGWSLETALHVPREIAAAVIYYGHVVTEPARLAALEAPLLGVFGGRDTAIPVAQVREFEEQLRRLGKDATILVYESAEHAFANPSGMAFEPDAALDAWQKTLAFLAKHLRPEERDPGVGSRDAIEAPAASAGAQPGAASATGPG